MGRQAEGPRPPWGWLAATILSSCFLLTQTQAQEIILVRTEPSQPLKGGNITLTPEGKANFITCTWYRGEQAEANRIFIFISTPPEQQNGPKFSGRETAGPGCSLHIRNLTMNDSGNYTVGKIVSGGSEAGRIHIEVLEPLTKPSVSAFPTPFPRELVSINLTCETTSGEASVFWFYNGEPLISSPRIQISEDNRTVVIRDAFRNDTGDYQCEVTNLVSTNRSDSLYIAVIYGPETPVIQPNESSYNQHDEIRLRCDADALPDPHYIWFLDGKELATTSELLIPDAAPENSGSYVCQASNVLTHQKSNATLKLEVVGQVSNVTITSYPDKAIENQLFVLDCSSADSNASYVWSKGDQILELGGHVVVGYNTLTFSPVIRNDAGSYTCSGHNSFSSSSATYVLDVFYGPNSPIIDPQVSVYNEGSTLNLSCFAESNPPANYSWWYNDQPLEDQKNSQLLIWDFGVSHAGNYTCNATNAYTGSSNITSIEITIQERVSNVTITSQPDKAIENQLFVLDCSSAGSDASYTWAKEDQILESEGRITLGYNTLTFSPVIRNDAGSYTCSGNNSFSSSNVTYQLDVFYGPDSPIIDPQVSVYNEGSTLSLSCLAECNPPANYSWWYNYQPLEDQKDSQLLIRDLSVSHAGNYTCNATNEYTGSSNDTNIEITIREKVSNVIITSQPNKAIENQLVVLDCSSAGSNVSYFWSKGDQTLESGGRITLGYKNLTISPVTRYDKGNYTCLGRNSFSNFSAIYPLDVFYGPDEPVISPSMQDYVEGSPLTLFCHAESDPPAQYTWSSNKTENPETRPQLSISSLSFDHAGNYICNASNPETGVFNSTTLEIRVWEKLFPPYLWPEEFFVKEHMNITLNCTTSEHSSITVSWFKDGKTVPTKAIPSKQNRTLTIPDISKDDEGLYTCEASNPGNSAMSNAIKVAVDSTSPPGKPGLSAGQIVGIVIGCLLGVALIVVVLYFALKSTGVGRMESHSSNGNIPSAPGRNQGVTDTKPTAGEEDIQYTTLAFNSNSPPQAGPGATSPLESGIIYSEIKKK